MSQTELANALGITFQQVQKYEKGVGAGRLTAIAEKLGVAVTSIFESVPAQTAVHASPLALLTERRATRLLKAFSEIDNLRLQDAIVRFVELAALKDP